MKVTIITVSYNSGNTIRKTLESVKNQTYNDIEFLVIDGHSTDNTVSIVQEFDNVDLFISEQDSGLYEAINKGVLLANGELIGILNSDDVFFDNYVISNVVEYHKHYKVDISVGDIVQYKNDIQNKKNKIVRFYSSKNWTPKVLKYGYMPPHPSMFVKKHIYSEFGLYKLNYLIAADYEIMIRYFLKNNVSWGYSGITTTKMLTGGVSTSGLKSYKMITKDIFQGFSENDIKFSKISVCFRFIFKIIELIKNNEK